MRENKIISDFDNSVINAIVNNPKLYRDNRNYITTDLFQNKYVKYIFKVILEYYHKYDNIPNFQFIEEIIKDEQGNEKISKMILDQLFIIKSIELSEDQIQFITDNLIKRLKDNKISSLKLNADKMDEDTIRKTVEQITDIEQKNKKWEMKYIWDEIENQDRKILPTKLELIDKYGISKGEIGLLMAATGVGKSVFLTYIANNFMLGGYKTLHLVFEGNIDNYIINHRRKLNNPTEEQLRRGNTTANLKIIKMSSNQTTTKDIEELIKDQINQDFVPDVVVIDYVDCLVSTTQVKEHWQGDIGIINELEHLSQKYNLAIWSAVQSNRSGINKDLDLSNAAGSISKLQKASMVIALTRTPEQEERNTADLKILKNRFGNKDTSYDATWNPSEMKIKTPINEAFTL